MHPYGIDSILEGLGLRPLEDQMICIDEIIEEPGSILKMMKKILPLQSKGKVV